MDAERKIDGSMAKVAPPHYNLERQIERIIERECAAINDACGMKVIGISRAANLIMECIVGVGQQ